MKSKPLLRLSLVAFAALSASAALAATENWWEENVVFGAYPIAAEPGAPPVETGGASIEIPSDLAAVEEQKALVQESYLNSAY